MPLALELNCLCTLRESLYLLAKVYAAISEISSDSDAFRQLENVVTTDVVHKKNHFEASTSSLVPSVIYTTQTTWVKYGYYYRDSLVEKLPDRLKNYATGMQRELLD